MKLSVTAAGSAAVDSTGLHKAAVSEICFVENQSEASCSKNYYFKAIKVILWAPLILLISFLSF